MVEKKVPLGYWFLCEGDHFETFIFNVKSRILGILRTKESLILRTKKAKRSSRFNVASVINGSAFPFHWQNGKGPFRHIE